MKVSYTEPVHREIELPLHAVEEVTIKHMRSLRAEQKLGAPGDWLAYHKGVQFVCENDDPPHGSIQTIYIRPATPLDVATLSIEKHIGELRVARSMPK